MLKPGEAGRKVNDSVGLASSKQDGELGIFLRRAVDRSVECRLCERPLGVARRRRELLDIRNCHKEHCSRYK